MVVGAAAYVASVRGDNQHYAEVGEREATNEDDHYYDDAKTKTIRR